MLFQQKCARIPAGIELVEVKRILVVVAVSICVVTSNPSYVLADCYAVVVGKAASADGSVLFGHDEQSGSNRIVNLRVIPRIEHPPGTVATLEKGGTLPELSETYSFIWSEIPELSFSDAYINEWGVAVASDGCPTREDSYEALVARGDIVDGGIGYMLRRLVVQRAKTAREGVQVAGGLLGQFGYWDSGRTLVVADANEAWILCIVRGKHWVAQRVPDDGVVLVPNVHIIREIDLADSSNFLGSPDIVDYAIERGWYDPQGGKPFSFRAAYNASSSDPWDARQREGQYLVTGQLADPDMDQLPFAVQPAHPMTVQDVITILRHDGATTICRSGTQEGAVFQLRSWLSPEIGCIYWRTSGEPCAGLLVPWYVGITETPSSYYKPADVVEQLTLSHHFSPPAGTLDYDPEMAWWDFMALESLVSGTYQASKEEVRAVWDAFEADFFARQSATDTEALALFSEAEDAARSYLTEYSGDLALQATELTGQIADALRMDVALSTFRPVALAVVSATRRLTAKAGQAVFLELTVGLAGPWETTGLFPQMRWDLSAVGLTAPVPLQDEGGGRYTASSTVTPLRSGQCYLPVMVEGEEGSGWYRLFGVRLDVYPAADLIIYDDAPGEGWTVDVTMGQSDPACSSFTCTGSFSHEIGARTVLEYVYEDPQGIDPFGYTLEFWINGGEGSGQSPIIAGKTLSELGVAPEANQWKQVIIPASELEGPLNTISITFGTGDPFYLDDMKLVAEELDTAVEEVSEATPVPVGYSLSQNVPNPFNPLTTIAYDLPEAGDVTLTIYAVTGQKVAAVVSAHQQPGHYQVAWDGRDGTGRVVASGLYFIRMQAGAFVAMRKMVALR